MNFNVDTDTEMFRVGGHRQTTIFGQNWNLLARPGVGFGSGNGQQGIRINGPIRGAISVGDSTLTVTRKQTSPVPESSTLLLFGTGMLGLLAYGTRRKRQAQAAA